MLSTVEEKMTDTFIEEEIPESFQPIYRRRLADGKDDSLEGQLLAIADKIDLLYESFEEISKSNPDKVYKEMFREAVMTVKNFNHRPSECRFLWKRKFSRRNRKPNQKLKWSVKQVYLWKKHTKSRGETHPSISSSSALSMLYVFEALFHRLFLLQQ